MDDFQQTLDLWTKGNFEQYKKKAKKLMDKDFKQSFTESLVFKKFERNKTLNFFWTAYHAQKALKAGASPQLPFATLKLLGTNLADEATKGETQKVIETNVLKYKGEFIKLDDAQQQSKIQKALIRKHFHSTSFSSAA